MAKKNKKNKKNKGKKEKSRIEEEQNEEEEIEIKSSEKKSSKQNSSNKKQKKEKVQKQKKGDKKDKKKSKKTPIMEFEEEEEEKKETKQKKIRKDKKPKQKKSKKKKELLKDNKSDSEDLEEDKKEKKSIKKEEKKTIKKVISKSGAVVDSIVPNSNDYHVVLDENNDFNGKYFSCTLNQSNLEHNNNKFYIIQLLQSDINSSYMLFTRWGRVGVRGEFKTENCSFENGKKLFIKKYNEKTNRGYKEIIIDYSDDDDDDDEKSNNKNENDQNKINEDDDKSKDELHKLLSDKVIEFIKLIYNTNIINQQMKEIGYDSSKMPLGKLAKESINKGYLILKEIEKELQKKSPSKSNLTKLSSDFFTYIPHDFGFKNMASFIIDTLEKLKSKIDMIETLKDMKVATKIIEDNKIDSESKIILNYYNQLHCTIKHISKKEEIYSLIEKYLTLKLNNQNTNHFYYGNQNLKLLEAYEIKREGEEEKYLKNYNNKMLLWHGTRISNFVGILSQGLRIAPPEAPSSGYLFGKGLYFADMSSKSCNYCYPVNNIGLILLCEVALGNIEKRYETDYQLPNSMKKGNNSIQGVGEIYPEKGVYIDKDVYVPCECPVQKKNDGFWGIMFNEFIVYDVRQVKLRYVLKIQFDY